MTLLYFVVIPIIFGVIIYAIPKTPLRILVILVEASLFVLFLHVLSDILIVGEMRNVFGATNSLMGIELVANRISIALIGVSIFLFSVAFIYTMYEEFFNKKFVMLFLILQGLLCGVFLSDDLFNIYVLLEVATIVVAILIMYKRDIRSMYDGIVYLFSQVVCMLFYLFGIGYLYKIFGVLSITKIREMLPLVAPESLVAPFAFIMTAICLKSAFFPLFSWLPRAHGTPSAPSAVSAILSGLYVKNGIYLFFVFTNLFKPAIDFSQFFMLIGTLTAVIGFTMALSQTDIKLLLAFSTISQIGLITLGLTSSSEISTYGAIYHILCHALFKSLLFLSAGMIIKQYHTRNMHEIRGVFKTMPLTSFATILGILGITGAPLFNGSISKYFILDGVKDSPIEIIIIIINFGTILTFIKYSHMLIGKKQANVPQPRQKNAAILLLGVTCIICGIFGADLMGLIFDTNFTIKLDLYLQKTIIYIISSTLAFLVYRHLICKNNALEKLRKLSLDFQQIVMAILVFYITVTITLSLQI